MIKHSKVVIIILSIILLLMTIFASLSLGSRYVNMNTVMMTLLTNHMSSLDNIVVLERIPRTLFALLAGSALGVSGTTMQAITRNPIADPSILGVNTGAALFVVAGISLFKIDTAYEYIGFALIGATLTSVLVFYIGSLGAGGATPIKLALVGAATSAALSSMISAIVLPNTEIMNIYRFWQVGSVSGASYKTIMAILPFLIVGLILCLLSATSLDALALGDELATGLGVKTTNVRLIGAASGVLLCGATTALAGPIGFVGLMVPHTMRLIFGSKLKIVLPMSALGGAILLTLSDIIGRLLGSPGELEAGIVTAFLGAPILIVIAMKAKVKAL